MMLGWFIALVCISSVLTADADFEARTYERFSDLEALIRGYSDRNSELETRLRKLETENESLRRQCGFKDGSGLKNNKRQLTTSTVAFTAVVSTGTIANLQNGQIIKFDKVITNMADAYKPTSGIFTAPISGVYAFNFALMSESGTREYLQIVKDGQYVLNNYAHATGTSTLATSSRTVTLELQMGNKVWIQTPPNFDHGDGSIHGNDYTTFSGWLIAYTE